MRLLGVEPSSPGLQPSEGPDPLETLDHTTDRRTRRHSLLWRQGATSTCCMPPDAVRMRRFELPRPRWQRGMRPKNISSTCPVRRRFTVCRAAGLTRSDSSVHLEILSRPRAPRRTCTPDLVITGDRFFYLNYRSEKVRDRAGVGTASTRAAFQLFLESGCARPSTVVDGSCSVRSNQRPSRRT